MGGITFEIETTMPKSIKLASEITSFLFEEEPYGECRNINDATIKHLTTARNSLLRIAKKHTK